MKILEDLKEGDWVFHIIRGWLLIESSSTLSLRIRVDGKAYCDNGHSSEEDVLPTLYSYDPINGTKPPKTEIDWDRVPFGTPIIALDNFAHNRIFVSFSNNTIRYVNEIYKEIVCASPDKMTIENPRKEWLKCI